MFRNHSQTCGGRTLKSMTIENKRKSSIWKSSETIQTEPKERWGCHTAAQSWVCCISFITVLLLLLLLSPSGPGPGRYALPPTVGYINHDFTKPSSPAYSFHSRMSGASELLDIHFTCHIALKCTRFYSHGSLMSLFFYA